MTTATHKRRTQRPRRNAEQAQSFSHQSLASEVQVAEAIAERAAAGVHPDCACLPYEDVFTYRRWEEQGMAVQKGEKAMKIATHVRMGGKVNEETGEEEGGRLYPRIVCLFCRCQTKEVTEKPTPA